jgi:peptidoglycan/xylan/chitin deacetylase (PgdA/CDA1 family)
MYHYVRDSGATPFPAVRALSPRQFEAQLDWLQREYVLLHPSRFEAAVREGGSPLPDKAAILTFDDGFADHYDAVFPILAARGLSGIFFLSGMSIASEPQVLNVHRTHFLLARLGPDAFGRGVAEQWSGSAPSGAAARVFGADRWEHPDERALKNLVNYEMPFEEASRLLGSLFAAHLGDERSFARALYLDRQQVREMAGAGMVFGYHTHTHRMLSRLPREDQHAELAGGVETIRALTGQRSVPFCYPWGGRGTYTAETIELLDELGYSLAFNTVRRRVAAGIDSRFELPRVDTRDLPPHTAGEPVPTAEVHG